MKNFLHFNPTTYLEIDSSDYIINCNWLENPELYGIPENMCIKTYHDYNDIGIIRRNRKEDDKLKVAYFQVGEDETDLKNMLQVVSLFNQLNSVDPIIFCNEKYLEILKSFSNDNIHYENKIIPNITNNIEVDVVITHGSGVIHFLKQQLPVLVMGPYGIGGWITPKNFHFLLKSGFQGRAGCTSLEYIPPEIFAHEMLSIKDCKDLPCVLRSNKDLADALPYNPLSDAVKMISMHKTKMKKLNDPMKRWKFTPVIASNIMFEAIGDKVSLKRRYIHDTLCTISRVELPFFQAINGISNCENLCKDLEMNEEEFWETIYILYEKKIILF